MKAMKRLISFLCAFIMILSGCTTDNIIETGSSLTTGGKTVNDTVTGWAIRPDVRRADFCIMVTYKNLV